MRTTQTAQTTDPRVIASYKAERALLARFQADQNFSVTNIYGNAIATWKRAKRDVALQDLEDAGRVRFVWEADDMPADNADWENAKYSTDPKERHQFETYARQWDRNMAAGRISVECCAVEVPPADYDPDKPFADESWETGDSLCGIEFVSRGRRAYGMGQARLDYQMEQSYRRDTEIELALEAGVIDDGERAQKYELALVAGL